jgi:hypothetical protein
MVAMSACTKIEPAATKAAAPAASERAPFNLEAVKPETRDAVTDYVKKGLRDSVGIGEDTTNMNFDLAAPEAAAALLESAHNAGVSAETLASTIQEHMDKNPKGSIDYTIRLAVKSLNFSLPREEGLLVGDNGITYFSPEQQQTLNEQKEPIVGWEDAVFTFYPGHDQNFFSCAKERKFRKE